MRPLKYLFAFLLFFFSCSIVLAQVCNTLGQRPSTAFPVCGIDTFSQTIVPTCDNKAIPVPGCSNAAYSDKNPFWYKFTCFTSGTFGFLITPTDLGDDYDWQIFDITGRSPDDVYTDVSLVVIGNWSGSSGPTGASSSGSFAIECASDPRVYENTFSKMPVLTEGHTYLLMVSHYTDSQIGYQLSFGGGTASITDPVDPAINTASASCDGLQITVKLSKKMKCSSLANDGSDFTIPGSAIKVISAIGIGCSNGFDMDSVVLKLSAPLLPGNYSLAAQKGADENTLLDNCNQSIAAGNAVPFVVYGRQPTPFDSIVPVQCAPQILELSFRKNIDCSSIDADGSDFQVTGPYPVIVLSASGNCADGVSSSIFIKLSSPVVHEGTYTITLFKGNDGNTIIDECGEETPSGATINFYVKDTVSANFTYDLFEGCRYDSIHFYHNGANAVNQWYWTFDGTQFTPDQNPHAIYNTFGDKSIKLWVSNGFCTDSSELNLFLNHDALQAGFTGPSVYCPNDIAYFKDSSTGTILAWSWEFGNGYTSTLQNPPPQYYPGAEKDRLFPVRLIVISNKLCTDTALKFIKVVNNCYIAVPTAFTPNKDGRNDYLYPLNAYKATHLEFKIYNKYGQQLFATKDWTRKWDGTIGGVAQPSGVYVWFLQYTDGDTGKSVFQKGTTVLIR